VLPFKLLSVIAVRPDLFSGPIRLAVWSIGAASGLPAAGLVVDAWADVAVVEGSLPLGRVPQGLLSPSGLIYQLA